MTIGSATRQNVDYASEPNMNQRALLIGAANVDSYLDSTEVLENAVTAFGASILFNIRVTDSDPLHLPKPRRMTTSADYRRSSINR